MVTNGNEKLISILIPAYNVEAYLDICMESVIRQTYTNLEIILVDDGSTDNTTQMCDLWADRDNRIKVYHNTNQGLAQTRNFMLKKATGELVCFVDSDDYIELSYVESLYSLLIKSGADMAGCRFCRVDGDKVIKPAENSQYNFCIGQEDYLKRMYNNLGVFIPAWGKMTRLDAYKDIEYPKGKLHEDGYAARKLAFQCKKIAWCQEPLYYYRYNDKGITEHFSIKRMEDDLGWMELDEKYFESSHQRALKNVAEKVYCFSILNYWENLPKENRKKYVSFYTKKAFSILWGRANTLKARIKYFLKIPYIVFSSGKDGKLAK